jgi:hypothetical protein
MIFFIIILKNNKTIVIQMLLTKKYQTILEESKDRLEATKKAMSKPRSEEQKARSKQMLEEHLAEREARYTKKKATPKVVPKKVVYVPLEKSAYDLLSESIEELTNPNTLRSYRKTLEGIDEYFDLRNLTFDDINNVEFFKKYEQKLLDHPYAKSTIKQKLNAMVARLRVHNIVNYDVLRWIDQNYNIDDDGFMEYPLTDYTTHVKINSFADLIKNLYVDGANAAKRHETWAGMRVFKTKKSRGFKDAEKAVVLSDGTFIARHTKGGEKEFPNLHPTTIDAIQQYVKLKNIADGGYLFTMKGKRNKEPYSKDSFSKEVWKVLKTNFDTTLQKSRQARVARDTDEEAIRRIKYVAADLGHTVGTQLRSYQKGRK